MPCNKLFAYWWWKVFLEFGVLIAVIVILALSEDPLLPFKCLPCKSCLNGNTAVQVASAMQPCTEYNTVHAGYIHRSMTRMHN